ASQPGGRAQRLVGIQYVHAPESGAAPPGDPMTLRDAASEAVLARLLEEHNLAGEKRLYREAMRTALTATATPGVYRLAANPSASESVIDVYGPGYVVQAERTGPGLAFAES